MDCLTISPRDVWLNIAHIISSLERCVHVVFCGQQLLRILDVLGTYY